MDCLLCGTSSRDAIINDHFDCFKDIVLSYGSSPNKNDHIHRDLCISIVYGKIKFVEFLFDLGADPTEGCIQHSAFVTKDDTPMNPRELVEMMIRTATTKQNEEKYREMEELINFYTFQRMPKEPSE